MKISTKGRYGLEALLDMAMQIDEAPIKISSIAMRQGLSEKYLEQIFSSLKNNGIVRSVRGAQGGYLLARPINQITVREILTALEGPLSPVACATKGCDVECGRFDFCVTKAFWGDMAEALNQATEAISLSDVLECLKEENNSTQLDFSI